MQTFYVLENKISYNYGGDIPAINLETRTTRVRRGKSKPVQQRIFVLADAIPEVCNIGVIFRKKIEI